MDIKKVVEDNWYRRNFGFVFDDDEDLYKKLQKETEFLDRNYKQIPIRTRGYVIFNDITEETLPKCACGCGKVAAINKNTPADGFMQYHKSSCATRRVSSQVLNFLSDKEWFYEQRVNLKKSFDVIAKELKISPTTVKKWAKVHNIDNKIDSRVKSPESRKTLEDKEMLAALYNSGLTTKRIGEMLGVNKQSVNNWLRKHGIPIRKKGQQLEVNEDE